MERDIEDINDIRTMVNSFYDVVKEDQVIGHFFNDVVKVNWEEHLPVMYEFWQQIIFQTGNYKGDPMATHQRVHHLAAFNSAHFDRWQELFLQTVDRLFQGDNANLAKQRAVSIITVMRIKLLHNGVGLR